MHNVVFISRNIRKKCQKLQIFHLFVVVVLISQNFLSTFKKGPNRFDEFLHRFATMIPKCLIFFLHYTNLISFFFILIYRMQLARSFWHRTQFQHHQASIVQLRRLISFVVRQPLTTLTVVTKMEATLEATLASKIQLQPLQLSIHLILQWSWPLNGSLQMTLMQRLTSRRYIDHSVEIT